MRRRSIFRIVIGSVALAATATIIAVVVRRSRGHETGAPTGPKVEASPEWMRRFATARFNPFVVRLGLVGGHRSPWAFIEHVGRRSGTVYRTPVLPRFLGDHAYVPLPYGPDTQWLRNVRTAGHCRIQRHGAVYELDEPVIVTPAEHPGVPASMRDWLEQRGRRYLRLHVLAAQVGTLDDVPATGAMTVPPSATEPGRPGSPVTT